MPSTPSSDRLRERIVPRAAAMLVGAFLVALGFSVRDAGAYTPENHTLSVRDAAGNLRGRATPIVVPAVNAIVAGVEEPDALSLGSVEIAHQRVEPGSYGTRREMLPERVLSQSIHGSPNPTRGGYGESTQERAWRAAVVDVPAEQLSADRYPLEIYAYSTNEQVRNRILVNASQFLCVAYTHADEERAARSVGWLMHMLGDTYSASHVQRAEPEGGPDGPCGTEKITWFFSMDTISWKLHRPADLAVDDWRYRCLVEHAEGLLESWAGGRAAVRAAVDAEAMREAANERVLATLTTLCEQVLRMDEPLLGRPAGGAAAGFSSSSGTDYWQGCDPPGPDRPIEPLGLTGEEEARDWQRSVNAALGEGGAPFWYPPRGLGDLCAQLAGPEGPPVALQCSAEEVAWATTAASQVESPFIPPRASFR